MINYDSKLLKWLFWGSPAFIRNGCATAYSCLKRTKHHGKHFHRWYQRLVESQWLQTSELLSAQWDSTKRFLEYANLHSPYYSNLFRQYRFDPRQIKGPDELQALPVLTKQRLREHLDAILPDDVDKMKAHWTHTSGTTGLGLRLKETAECLQREFAFRVLNISWGNVEFGDRWAYCAGHPVAAPDSTRPPFWVRDHFKNWLLMSSSHMTEKNLSHYVRTLEKFRPALVAGYPSSVYLLALAVRSLGAEVRPRAVLTSSETLFDHQRAVIESAFGCKAFSHYGNTERCASILECERGRMHLQLEHSYVELVDANGDPVPSGEEGRLVCTGFGNYATPLIRYDVGDTAVWSDRETCECGRGGRLVEKVCGRNEDYVITPDGRMVGRLDHLFKKATHVKLAQIQQERLEEVVIVICAGPGYSKAEEEQIASEARARMGSAIRIRFEYVDDIPRTASGKFRFVVSKVPRSEIPQLAVS